MVFSLVSSLVLLACAGTGCSKSGGARTGATSSGGADGAGTGGVGGTPSSGDGAGGTIVPAATGGTVASSGGSTEGGGGNGAGGAPGQDVPATGGAAGSSADAGVPPPIIDAFAATAREIAADYASWGRVDDELRWAPGLCRIPLPGIARQSQSNDATTHGQKLYSVFAKHREAYPGGPQSDQVVVKQSWTAELVTTTVSDFAPASAQFAPDAGDHFYAYAKGDGGVYRAADFAGLYIMFKLDPTTPDTDDGWVYATITAAGQVTAAGRVASCMGCHEVATHERLFGVPLSPTLSN